jgi:hypothetical protein
MRLPVDGVYAERKALAAIWIEHKGISCPTTQTDKHVAKMLCF